MKYQSAQADFASPAAVLTSEQLSNHACQKFAKL
jgi:hypothetical protein